MTTTTRVALFLLAFAAAATLSTSAHASGVTTAAEGDVLMGIRNSASGYTSSYVIDLGSISNFLKYTTPKTFQLTLADITFAVGSDFLPVSDGGLGGSSTTFWGAAADSGVLSSVVSGVPVDTVFATANIAVAPYACPWTSGNTTSNNGGCSSIKNATVGGNSFLGQNQATLSNATIQQNSLSNSWANGINKNSGNISWGYFSYKYGASSTASGAEAPFTDGVGSTTSRLYLYEIFKGGAVMPNGSTAVTGVTPGLLIGYFDMNASALVTFTPVPEPSSFALLGMGAGLFGLVRRRSVKV